MGKRGRKAPDWYKGNITEQTTTIRLTSEDLNWLKSQPHGVSFNVREAVRLLRQQREMA